MEETSGENLCCILITKFSVRIFARVDLEKPETLWKQALSTVYSLAPLGRDMFGGNTLQNLMTTTTTTTTSPAVTHCGGSITFWTCVAARDTVLGTNTTTSLKKKRKLKMERGWFLQHGNNSVHLRRLNIRENLWTDLKGTVHKRRLKNLTGEAS